MSYEVIFGSTEQAPEAEFSAQPCTTAACVDDTFYCEVFIWG